MTSSDWIAIALPCATILLATFATYAGPLGTYLAERTHNERLGRIVGAAGRIAAEAADTLAEQPATSTPEQLKQLKGLLISNGAKDLAREFNGSAAAVTATLPKLEGIISGEMKKLPPKVLASSAGQAALAAATVLVDPAKETADPAPEVEKPVTVPVLDAVSKS